MASDLLPVWNSIEKYLEDGISVIPVRDHDEDSGVAKSPYGQWKQYQKRIISKDELFDQMDRYNTTAIGILGGKVSGNLEIIDIDVKYKPGIDADLFAAIHLMYPDLAMVLRIHKSPSGGYHILYRCESPVQGNQKLAGCLTDGKAVNFIETRGEGGYVLAPPSMGYAVTKDKPIPVLTTTERESLLSLCRSFSEIIKVERPAPVARKENDYYDTNPFDDFNNRVDPTELIESLGWTFAKGNHSFLWYTRPGKAKGISISFNLHKRFYYCFTGSTQLEESHGYSPANLLSALQFNGDKKKLYAHLVSKGYGQIKPGIEKRIAKAAATNNKPLPANISPDASSIHAAISAAMQSNHPYGVFWIDSMEKGVVIDRERLLMVARDLGFMLYNTDLVQSDGSYIDPITDRHFYDTLKEYIKEEDADLYKDICNAYESFIEQHGRFLITRLPILAATDILADTIDTAYKVYTNGVLAITANSIAIVPTTKLIWRSRIQPRQYNEHDEGIYVDFLRKAVDYDLRRNYIMQVIGYLAHEYKDETAGYIIVLTEKCEDPADGGGAGKNVFSELFRNTTSFVSKAGSLVKYDEKFMQFWNFQKIVCISDALKNFNFSFLKELSTGTGLMKKLFKNEIEISSRDMPKYVISTNFSFEIKDGGLKRRIRQIEFTDFFTVVGGLDVHYGKHFPNDWDANDWAGYDTIMAKSIQQWLIGGRKIGTVDMSDAGWVKQFEQTWGQVAYHFITQNIDYWRRIEWLSNDQFKRDLDQYFIDNNTPPMYRPSMMRINKAIKDWCDRIGVQFSFDEIRLKERGKVFGSGELPF